MNAAARAAKESTDGITAVALADLIALRAQAAKPFNGRMRDHSMMVGGHAAKVRGRGMDYAESRVYQPGDDVRNIDWRRTARSGRWHTKLYESERERSLLLVIDTHASMRFGTRTRFKSVAAARAAAWLAWSGVRGGDRVGAIAFGAVRAACDPHGGTRGALAVQGALARWDAIARNGAEAAEPLSIALARAQRLAMPGCRVWLFSDGWCTDTDTASALARLARHAEVRVVIVADALERELPVADACVFETPSGRALVDLARAGPRAQFRERMGHGRLMLADACAAAGVASATLGNADEPWRVLAPLIKSRARRA